MIGDIRINWIEEANGYVAARINDGEVVFSAFDTMAEEAYFTLIEIMCWAEQYDANMEECRETIEGYKAYVR